jgi:hypothetical protein
MVVEGNKTHYFMFSTLLLKFAVWSVDSSLGIVANCGMDGRGSVPGRGERFFVFSIVSRPSPGSTRHPLQWVPGALSLGVKRSVRKADRSPPSSAEVKNGGAISPLPHTFSCRDA